MFDKTTIDLKELIRIRKALEIIALHYARIDNRMWSPDGDERVKVGLEEEAELLHTRDEEMKELQELKLKRQFTQGFKEDE